MDINVIHLFSQSGLIGDDCDVIFSACVGTGGSVLVVVFCFFLFFGVVAQYLWGFQIFKKKE